MLANGGWDLTLILLTWTIWRAPTNASKWRMGFKSAFKGLKNQGNWKCGTIERVLKVKYMARKEGATSLLNEYLILQVVTINGVRISRDKHDIPIPQGIAHAVEKVMFPLPVGNIIQTLRSDRERRFTKFLRAIQTSGLTDTLTGNLPLAFHIMVLGISRSLVRGHRCFGGKLCLHLQDIKGHGPEDHSVNVHVRGNLIYRVFHDFRA